MLRPRRALRRRADSIGTLAMKKHKKIIRMGLSLLIVAGMFGIYIHQFYRVQIIHGAEYAARGEAARNEYVDVPAARGEILDRAGNPLVINRQGNSIQIEAAYFPPKTRQNQRSAVLYGVLKLLKAQGEKYTDNLPLLINEAGEPVYKADEEALCASLKKHLRLNDYATAQNCMDALVEAYALEAYAVQDARDIASVCFDLDRSDFSVQYPYKLAQDVKEDTVLKIKEKSADYPGIATIVEPFREYADGTFAPHLLGMVGPIPENELAAKLKEGYKMNDTIGLGGIESGMEQYLKGKPGKKKITTDFQGNKTEEYIEDPVQGNTIQLTLDRDLQITTQNALADMVEGLRAKYAVNRNTGGPATGGACVVIDLKDGGILASASYPTYDISKYREQAAQLNTAENSPLHNRAMETGYPPGSTFKPGVALAGLSSGTITPQTHLFCSGTYTVYASQGYTPSCLGTHGSLNLATALQVSCNSYFFEVGRLTGINTLNEYTTLLGLGKKTGVEVAEATGLIAGPEEREAAGKSWYPGDTIQAAIGQSDNLFTPLQLASYVSTIANNGIRYQPHLVKTITDYSNHKVLLNKEAVVACDTGISTENINAVKYGMLLVSQAGTVGINLKKLPVQVGCKTGSAQVPPLLPNGVFISFAPYDNPEIAIASVVEHSNNGSVTSAIHAEIYQEYFSRQAAQ